MATPLPTVYSSTKQTLEYLTVAGIAKRIGCQKRDLPIFCLGQLIDNAADFVEKCYLGTDDSTTITAHISKQEIPDIGPTIRMSVRNPNNHNILVFTNLSETLNPSTFFSDKRNIFKVGRGAQGDGLKNNLMIPYAIWTDTTASQRTEDSFGDKSWPVPLIFHHNGIESNVYLLVDRSNNESPITTDIVERPSAVDGNFTEVAVTIPMTDDISNYLEKDHFGLFRRQCQQFALFNTHLSFQSTFLMVATSYYLQNNPCRRISQILTVSIATDRRSSRS